MRMRPLVRRSRCLLIRSTVLHLPPLAGSVYSFLRICLERREPVAERLHVRCKPSTRVLTPTMFSVTVAMSCFISLQSSFVAHGFMRRCNMASICSIVA